MDKLKAYVVVGGELTDNIKGEINTLSEECKGHIEVIYKDPKLTTYADHIDSILDSQILICYLDSNSLDYGVGCEASIFVSSLITLEKLGISHSAKLIVGQFKDTIDQDSIVLGVLGKYGLATTCIEATLESIIDYHNRYTE